MKFLQKFLLFLLTLSLFTLGGNALASERKISFPQVTLRTPEPQARIVDGKLELLISTPADIQTEKLEEVEKPYGVLTRYKTDGTVFVLVMSKVLDQKTAQAYAELSPEELTTLAMQSGIDEAWDKCFGLHIRITQYYDYYSMIYNNVLYEFCNFAYTIGRILYKDSQYVLTRGEFYEYCYGYIYSQSDPFHKVGTTPHSHSQAGEYQYPQVGQDYYFYDSEPYWYDVAPWGSYCYSRWTVYFTRGTANYSLPVDFAVSQP